MPDSPSPAAPGSAPALPPVPDTGPADRQTADHWPLPDPVAVFPVSVPDAAPPFDDAVAWPATWPVWPGQPPAIRVATPGDPATPGAAAPATARPAQPPEHGPWPSNFAQVLAETLVGSRPPGQLTPWTTEQTRRKISQLGPLLATSQRPRVRRVIVTCPAPDVLEMTIIVHLGPRVRALAVRLERARNPESARGPQPTRTSERGTPRATTGRPGQPDRWCCTAVEAA